MASTGYDFQNFSRQRWIREPKTKLWSPLGSLRSRKQCLTPPSSQVYCPVCEKYHHQAWTEANKLSCLGK